MPDSLMCFFYIKTNPRLSFGTQEAIINTRFCGYTAPLHFVLYASAV